MATIARNIELGYAAIAAGGSTIEIEGAYTAALDAVACIAHALHHALTTDLNPDDRLDSEEAEYRVDEMLNEAYSAYTHEVRHPEECE